MIEVKYIETRDKWALFTDGNFNSYVGADMAQKVTFINGVQGIATTLAGTIDSAADLYSIFFDRAYNSGGANEM